MYFPIPLFHYHNWCGRSRPGREGQSYLVFIKIRTILNNAITQKIYELPILSCGRGGRFLTLANNNKMAIGHDIKMIRSIFLYSLVLILSKKIQCWRICIVVRIHPYNFPVGPVIYRSGFLFLYSSKNL